MASTTIWDSSSANLTWYIYETNVSSQNWQVTMASIPWQPAVEFSNMIITNNGSRADISSIGLVSATKMALTIDEAAPASWFYYTDYIQNWFTALSPSTADMSNLFTGIYWKWTSTQTKNAWWYGLSGNQIFLRQQWAGKIDGAQAAAPTVLFNNGRLGGDVAASRAFFSNRWIIDSAAYYRWEKNNYIWPWGTFTEIYWLHFKTWALSGADVVKGYWIVIEDDVENVLWGSLEVKKIISNGTISVPVTTTTTNITLNEANNIILCDATSWAITVSLPDASLSPNVGYTIKKTDSSLNAVIVDWSWAQTIDWSATVNILTQYQWYWIHNDWSNRFITSTI